jgi:hypothetical protein
VLLQNLTSIPGHTWIPCTLHRGMQQIQKWIKVIETPISTASVHGGDYIG